MSSNLCANGEVLQKGASSWSCVAGGAPTNADYLVGTANGSLSAEIVVGTSPGGELGNTWASPTLDDSVAVTSWNLTTPTITTSATVSNGGTIGQAAGPLITFDDTANELEISGGNVGIGTTAPLSKLHIIGAQYDTQNRGNILSQDDAAVAANIGGGVLFGGNYTGTTKTIWASVSGLKESATDGEYGGFLAFYTRLHGASNQEKMRITSTGNVGIGTTTPASHLQIDGNISASAWTTNGIAFDSNAATYTDTSTAAAGTVTVRTANSFGAPTFASTNAITVTDAFTLYVPKPIAGTNTTITRANSAYFEGNVGIGTTGPLALLEVSGGASAGVIAIREASGSGTNNATFTVPALAADTDYTLPTTDGDASQFLQTDGAGALTWATSAGSGDITAVGDTASGAAFNALNTGTTLTFSNATSGTIALTPVTGALGTVTLSLPAATDTLVGKATTDTLTNKTLVAANNVIEADTVITNANLTGEVTSVGNAAVLGSFASASLLTALTNETGTGVAVFGTDPAITAPAVSGTPNAAGELGYNTTQAMQTTYGGITAVVAPIHGTIATGVGTQTLTNSVSTDQDFTSMYTFPANSIYTNKVYRVIVFIESVSGTSTVTYTTYLKLGSTKVYTHQGTIDLTNGRTRNITHSYLIMGRDAAGASANVSTSAVGLSLEAGQANSTNQPVALATNGTLTVNFGITYSGTGSTETMEQQGFIIEELN